ncbi:glycosyltransferase family 4 protein [Planctomycetota bacterium]
MKHILYIYQYFATPKGSTGTRSYEFAKHWVKAGHKVVMLTTVAQLTKQDLQNSTGRFIKRIIIDGIDVKAVSLPYNQKMGFIRRSFSFIGFVLIASVYLLFVKSPDVIYATSTPLTVGIPALSAKWLRRIPFVFEVRDQWPQIPIELGIIKNKLLIKILLWLEKIIYKNSSAVVALSPGMAEGVRDVTGNSKRIKIVSNCSDLDLFRPDIDSSGIRQDRSWNDKFILLHFGAMGKANGLDFVVNLAEKLADNKNIHFVLVGGGGEKQKLKDTITRTGLDNIEIFDSVPKAQLPYLVAAADVSMVIFANHPILEHNSANKFFDSLSAGKPVLLNYSGWQRKVLEDNNAGLGCDICNVDQFVANVTKLYNDRELVKGMARNARKLAEHKFSRDMLAKRVMKVLETVNAKNS